MPVINLEQQQRDIIAKARERMRATYQRGSFIVLDAAPMPSMMVVDGRPVIMRPLKSGAEIEAEKRAAWAKEFERKFLSYW